MVMEKFSEFCVTKKKSESNQEWKWKNIKDDLWEALEEYPEARKNLLEKGPQILMKVSYCV